MNNLRKYQKYLCIAGLMLSLPVFATTSVYEDFSSTISMDKFWGDERNLELDTVNDNLKLSQKARSFTSNGRSNWLGLDDTSGSMIQADLSVSEVSLSNSETQTAL